MEFLNPEQILNQLDLRPGLTAADFGSGSGGWTIPLAKKINPGRVYAVDVQKEVLDALQTQATASQLHNIKAVAADLEQGSSLQTGLLDLVLLTNILFQVKNKAKLLSEAARVLKTGGQLLVVDWKPEASLGPTEGRLTVDQVKELLPGFVLEREIPAGAYHWALLFREL